MRAGGFSVLGSGTTLGVSTIREVQTAYPRRREASSLVRSVPAPHVAPPGTPGRRGIPLRRLARGGGTIVLAGAPARPAGRVRLAVPRAVCVPSLARAARTAGGARLAGRGRGLRRTPPVLDRSMGGVRRARGDRGSGAVRAGMVGVASVRAGPRRP